MSTVFFMKFNRDQGALVADEMTWHLGFKYGYRPSRYGDQILNLLDSDTAVKNRFAAVYAGVGFPSLHFEVVNRIRREIHACNGCIGDLDRTSELVQEAFQEVHGRFINDKLRFLLGFDRDQMNLGKFTFRDKEYDIKQEAVISEARKILKYQDKSEAFHRIFDNEGLVMGYDRDFGIRAYHVSNSGRGLDFAYPFDALGEGKEIGTKIFADIAYRMNLEHRREGFSFSEGLFLLMNAFVEAYDFNNKAGGYVQVLLIDGRGEFFKELTSEISDHRSYLTAEVIRAYRWGFIPRCEAQCLTDRLLVQGEEWEPLEKELFERASDPERLRMYLSGFKPTDTPRKPLD